MEKFVIFWGPILPVLSLCLDFLVEGSIFCPMALTLKMVTQEALGLPSSGRALLAEKLLASLAGEANPAIERIHLVEIRKRRAAVHAGKAGLIDGSTGLRQARAALRK